MKLVYKKTAIALGLVALSATAMAQDSSLTIYGKVDNTLESIKLDGQRLNRLNSSGSYFGFTGSEDLGSGLKVGFTLEANYRSDDGSINADEGFFSSNSEINIEGAAGMLRLGRYYNPSYYAIADPVSLHHGDSGISADLLYAGVENTNNRIGYTSPELGGLVVETSVSLHEDSASPAKNAYDLALNYEAGNWSFGAGYGKWAQANQWALRATWSDGPWTISGYHQRSKDWDANWDVYAPVAGDGKRNVTRIAVAYAWESSDVHANFGRANGPDSQSAKQWSVGYNYHLSKRTKLYAIYTSLSNKNGAAYGGADSMGVNSSLKGTILGLRHLF